MLKLKQKYTQAMLSVDLSDPVMVETMLADLSKKLEQLETKRGEITDPVQLEKFQKELDNLSKKCEMLKARLAELKGAR